MLLAAIFVSILAGAFAAGFDVAALLTVFDGALLITAFGNAFTGGLLTGALVVWLFGGEAVFPYFMGAAFLAASGLIFALPALEPGALLIVRLP